MGPDDLAQAVWLRTLPKLARIQPRDGRYTPPLLAFMSSVLEREYYSLLRRELRAVEHPLEARAASPNEGTAAAAASPTALLASDERARAVVDALERLDPLDREVLLSRAMDETPYRQLADGLGASVEAVRMRYSRALRRLALALPDSIVAELSGL